MEARRRNRPVSLNTLQGVVMEFGKHYVKQNRAVSATAGGNAGRPQAPDFLQLPTNTRTAIAPAEGGKHLRVLDRLQELRKQYQSAALGEKLKLAKEVRQLFDFANSRGYLAVGPNGEQNAASYLNPPAESASIKDSKPAVTTKPGSETSGSGEITFEASGYVQDPALADDKSTDITNDIATLQSTSAAFLREKVDLDNPDQVSAFNEREKSIKAILAKYNSLLSNPESKWADLFPEAKPKFFNHIAQIFGRDVTALQIADSSPYATLLGLALVGGANKANAEKMMSVILNDARLPDTPP